MRKAIEFIVYSNIWISAGAAGFGSLYYFLNNSPFNLNLIAFLFCSTLLTYTFQRFEKLRNKERTTGPRMEWMIRNLILVYALLILSFLSTIYFVWFISLESILILLALGPISFLYAVKMKIGTTTTNLRDIPFIKIVLIGIVWAISCYLIPFAEEGRTDFSFLLPTIALFLYIIGITIPFDIRDLDVDEKSKRTIPQLFGEQAAKYIAIVFITSAALILYYQFKEQIWAIALTHFISIVIVWGTSKRRDELYFSFLIDGLLVVLAVGFYLLNNL